MDTSIIVHEDDIVVEDEDVDKKHGKLDKESEEETNETRILCPLIVVVKLEEVSIGVLICHINDCNQEKVKTSSKSIPSYELAQTDWEAVNELLREVADTYHESKKNGIHQRARNDNKQLLGHCPVSIFQFNLIIFPLYFSYRSINRLQ